MSDIVQKLWGTCYTLRGDGRVGTLMAMMAMTDRIDAHRGGVEPVAFSPDGRLLASGGYIDEAVRVRRSGHPPSQKKENSRSSPPMETNGHNGTSPKRSRPSTDL